MTAPDMSASIDAAKVEAFPVRGIADDLAAERAALRVTDPGDWLDGKPMDPHAVAAEPHPDHPRLPVPARRERGRDLRPNRRRAIVACAGVRVRRGTGRTGVAYLGSEVTEPEFDARAADLASRRGDEHATTFASSSPMSPT